MFEKRNWFCASRLLSVIYFITRFFYLKLNGGWTPDLRNPFCGLNLGVGLSKNACHVKHDLSTAIGAYQEPVDFQKYLLPRAQLLATIRTRIGAIGGGIRGQQFFIWIIHRSAPV
jgi:hypothetical protein